MRSVKKDFALFDATMTGIGGVIVVVRDAGELFQNHFIEMLLDRRVQRLLVLLHADQIISATLDDRAADVLLAAQRINGDGGAAQIDQAQNLQNPGQFRAFSVGLELREHLAVVVNEQADQVRHAALVPAALEGSAQAFAVDRHQLAAGEFDHRLHPAHEAALKRVGVQRRKHAPECVRRRHAVAKVHEGVEPFALGVGEVFKVLPSIGVADDGADRDDDDVDEPMTHVGGTVIGQIKKKAQRTSGRKTIHGKLRHDRLECSKTQSFATRKMC